MHTSGHSEKALDSMDAAAKDVAASLRKRVGELAADAGEASSAVIDKSKEALSTAVEKSGQVADDAKGGISDARDMLEKTVRTNPVMSIALALASGLIVGAMWNSRR